MSYRFRRSEPVADAVRRVVREEMQAAIATASGPASSVTKRIHDVRTSCKKIRGVLRLVRPRLGDVYRDENVFFRDAARELSGARDRAVVLEVFDAIAKEIECDRAAVAALRKSLAGHLTPGADDRDAAKLLVSVSARMEEHLAAIDAWPLDGRGFQLVREGLADTYRNGRTSMRQALESGDSLDWHEWRKQAKYHWYHVRLLRNAWKPAMDVRREELDRLAELLGSEHDRTVLRESSQALEESGDAVATSLLARTDIQRAEIREAARPLGERLFAESAKAFQKRMRCYWKVWRDE